MEKWKKDYLKELLSDYPKMDDYFLERRGKLLLSPREKSSAIDPQEADKKRLISISLDRQLINLERNQKIIARCLEDASSETNEIIRQLYMSQSKKKNLDLVADQVFLSKRQVIRLRDAFFEELAAHLGL